MNPSNIEQTETASLAGMSEAARLAGTASPETVGLFRRRLASSWRFARHLLEMVAAMVAGMAVLGVAILALGEPPGYADPLVEYSLMGAFMSASMVAWMRHRGHSWSDGLGMTAAMLAPMYALVLPAVMGFPGPTGHTLMMVSHVAMIGGMVALMIYRRDRYAHGARTDPTER